MKQSHYQKKKAEARKKRAIWLYKQGYTTREVGIMLGKSHTWVWFQIRKLPVHN